MAATEQLDWATANHRDLVTRLTLLRQQLEHYVAEGQVAAPSAPALPDAVGQPFALARLVAGFGLSAFEGNLLLLCAGAELDGGFVHLCATAQGDPQRSYPTFSLALAALPDAHWSALNPAAPLRRYRLLEVGSGDYLTTSPLHLDERVLHYLTGISYLDERLRGLFEQVAPATTLPPSQAAVAGKLAALLTQASGHTLVQLEGATEEERRFIAATAAERLGLHLYRVQASDLPTTPADRNTLVRLWEREAVLDGGLLLLEADSSAALAARFAAGVAGMLVVSSNEPLVIPGRSISRLLVSQPPADEQLALWQAALGPLAGQLNGQVVRVASQFKLTAGEIAALGTTLQATAEVSGEVLWDACRSVAQPRLGSLAERITVRAGWPDLVLPAPQQTVLHEVAAHVRQRARVYADWGFAAKSARGLGISALFAGPSGTGKTLAAEVLANELRLDLYRIDLSQVVNKYIGETEKNLRQVFDAAEGSGAILLFDEADALFGKRSEVKDSHDRYANIEVGYLLQRMEGYQGLAILTTNLKQSLDTAFLRRIRFIVNFPFPDEGQRATIWQHIFPAQLPSSGLSAAKLAKLSVAGGSIRNIALNAAFLAADADEVVQMKHLLQAARSECAKLERPLSEAEVAGW